MTFEVITYATHSERMFPELMNSGYPIKVLGWGEKWIDFHTKINGVLKYVKTKDPDDIIVYIDAFDTKILGDPAMAEKLFREKNCGFLVSLDTGTISSQIIFGTCKNGNMGNMGMWMGYVKYIIPILEDILNNTCKDDQIMFNSICHKYDFICIDTESAIFSNYGVKGIFKGYPFSVNKNIFIDRFIKEHFPHFILHITLITYILIVLLPTLKNYIIGIYIVTILVFLFKSKKMCMFKQKNV
jgi:hypothetical protein